MFRALLVDPQETLYSGTWYIARVLYQLAAPGMQWNFNSGATNRHNMHAKYKVPLVRSLLRMSK
jgi:hypothetical protein